MHVRLFPSRTQKRRALAGGLRQFEQHRLDDIVDVERGLVARTQPARGRPQPPFAVLPLNHIAAVSEGPQQAQGRGLVHAAAARQLGQGQALVLHAERFEKLECPRDGGDAA